MRGCVKELHEYAVPRQIMTIVPAAAMSQRFGVLDVVAKFDLRRARRPAAGRTAKIRYL
jgi:hypothetical protein